MSFSAADLGVSGAMRSRERRLPKAAIQRLVVLKSVFTIITTARLDDVIWCIKRYYVNHVGATSSCSTP